VKPLTALVSALFMSAALTIPVRPAQASVPEPAGYRLDHYSGAVPDTLRGASVVNTATLAQMIRARQNLVLIDVLPAPLPPADARPGLPRMPLPHRDIPGSLWLPEVGRGALSPQTEAWFRAQLRTATGGRTDRPVVFYCRANCWMSWNAAKRAVSYGYTQVIWYPDGADGWQAAGHETTETRPAK
jgi:PQQ-dependent catabolism-associated CXXCW motif protein